MGNDEHKEDAKTKVKSVKVAEDKREMLLYLAKSWARRKTGG